MEDVVDSYHSRGNSFVINCQSDFNMSTCSSLSFDFSEGSLLLEGDGEGKKADSGKLVRRGSMFQSNAAIVFDFAGAQAELLSSSGRTSAPSTNNHDNVGPVVGSRLARDQSELQAPSDDDFTYETIESNRDNQVDDDEKQDDGADCWSESLSPSQSRRRTRAIGRRGKLRKKPPPKRNSLMISNHTNDAVVHELQSDDSSMDESILSSCDDDESASVEFKSESEGSSSSSSYFEQSFSKSTLHHQYYESESSYYEQSISKRSSYKVQYDESDSSYYEQSVSKRSTFMKQEYDSDPESTQSTTQSNEPHHQHRPIIADTISPRSSKANRQRGGTKKASAQLTRLDEMSNLNLDDDAGDGRRFRKSSSHDNVMKQPIRRRSGSLDDQKPMTKKSTTPKLAAFGLLCLSPLKVKSPGFRSRRKTGTNPKVVRDACIPSL